jgi:flagellar protein FliO/FliZ
MYELQKKIGLVEEHCAMQTRSSLIFASGFASGLVGICGVFLSAAADAQTKAHVAITPITGSNVSPSTGLLQIFLALAAVIGLMLLIAWLFKRIGPINSMNKVPMKIIGGLNIGNRERIMVVEVADQWLVLGVTAQQINTLSSMPKQELPTTTAAETKYLDTKQENQFSYWLKKTLEKRSTPET